MSSMVKLLTQAVKLGLLRFLDIQLAQLLADNNHPVQLLVTACLSSEVGKGHIYLALSELNPDFLFNGSYPNLAKVIWNTAGNPQNWTFLLQEWSALSTKEKVAPIILVEDRLYLHRFWQYESKIVTFFQSRAMMSQCFKSIHIRSVLDKLFGNNKLDNWFKVAIAVALTKKISVISVSASNEKIKIITKLLEALILLSNGTLRIQLVAPTIKSTLNLTKLLSQASCNLFLHNSQHNYAPIEAITLPNLLGINQKNQRLRYHVNNPLHLDVLVINDASIINLNMMVNLINALPPQAQVIFIGDRNKLISFETGAAILSDLFYYDEVDYSSSRAMQLNMLTGCDVHSVKDDNPMALIIRDIICLRHNEYSFDTTSSGISQLALAVNSGILKSVKSILYAGFADVTYKPLNNSNDYNVMIEEIVKNYHYFLILVADNAEPIKIINAFRKYQLLCAVYEGSCGVYHLNYCIEQKLIQLRFIPFSCNNKNYWYHGKPILVTQNHSAIGLFNGDIGITLYDYQNVLRVFFLQSDGTIKTVLPSHLPAHDTAWAMTVYKTQGLEFEFLTFVMPMTFLPSLTRELIYNAITCACKKLTFYSANDILNFAIHRSARRRSGLLKRLTKS
ncbi:exodeoxyribonuclease V subunit alpha [Pantoea sp. Aalb]|uniref:exodeoxyribonuclease V subunit alpha n=1 Tax=Pantoea sp. Aalb TaxID=2576762 RepID=UPI0013267F66|nr:exodeoxyribonuclease V subunit alpha [Pantoea sp. Aalb]MXP67748.1 exodeoxyribonuclease V subunit alpha [Pantoea sp. Aalb]